MRDYLDDRPIKLRRNRSNTPASLRPFLLAAVLMVFCGGLLILDSAGYLTNARGSLERVLMPLAQPFTGARDALAAFAAAPRSEQALRERISALEAENAELQSEVLRREQAQIENVSLRQQLAIEQAQPWNLLGAEVAVRSPDAGRRIITIARGSEEGVTVGMAVIGQNPGGPAALIGIVETVTPHTATILLITDIGSQISARALHEQRTSLGLIAGQWQRGSRLQLTEINRSAPLTVGDPVVTAGLTGNLNLPLDLAAVPADIPIGTVESITRSGQTQTAEIRPFADPDQVQYVWVILNRAE